MSKRAKIDAVTCTCRSEGKKCGAKKHDCSCNGRDNADCRARKHCCTCAKCIISGWCRAEDDDHECICMYDGNCLACEFSGVSDSSSESEGEVAAVKAAV